MRSESLMHSYIIWKSGRWKALLWRLKIGVEKQEKDEANLLDLTFRISKQPLVEPAGLLIVDL